LAGAPEAVGGTSLHNGENMPLEAAAMSPLFAGAPPPAAAPAAVAPLGLAELPAPLLIAAALEPALLPL
jgi:hypothetical protein